MKIFVLSLWLAAGPLSFANGIIVYKTNAGIQFTEASSLKINDKDKVATLGPEPAASGPINKLPSVKIAGILLRDADSNVIAAYSAGQQKQFLYPTGLPKNAPANPAEAWKASEINYRKSQADKTGATIPAPEFLAYIPEGLESLAALCMDTAAMTVLGGTRGSFPMQIELLTAAVNSFGTQPAMAKVETYVRGSMQRNLDRFDNGLASREALSEGLQFAELSARAYSSSAEHQKLRSTLAERKAWLDRRMSILRALSSGREPDAFLLAYRDFEKHQLSYPDILKLQRAALQESLKVHYDAGKERLADREYQSAWRELKLASNREPGNTALQKELAMAWTEYSRAVAVDRRSRRKQLNMGQEEAIGQSLHFATRYREQGKLDEALKSVSDAEVIDNQNLEVLLRKAEILGARHELAKALTTLDQYDMYAVDDERSKGSKLRNELAFELTTALRDQKTKLESAWKSGRFHQTRRLAAETMKVTERDPDVLYYAGMAAYVTRSRDEARENFRKFLEVSNTVDSNPERRNSVFRLLRISENAAQKPAEQGEVNWFSGARLPANIVYDPLSLAFTPRVDRIKASNKLTVQYTWDGPRLRAITPAFEKANESTGEKPVVFSYSAAVPHAIGVDTSAAGSAPADADELLRQSSVLLLNNPLIDPLGVEQLTGQQITTVVTGNRFFHPFIWQRLYRFQIAYDAEGRIKAARELPSADTPKGSEVTVYFEWDGLRLMNVHAYQNATANGRGTQVYERKQIYQDGRLVGEEIHSGPKTSHIKYVWNAGTLVTAECEKDETMDNRSREVMFASSMPARRGK